MPDPLLVLNRAVDVHRRLLAAGIDNAIGGALALAYHVDDPRGTQDIDLNISLPSRQAVEALRALPLDAPWDDATLAAIHRDDQVRIMWPVPDGIDMPLDLFFVAAVFHETAVARSIEVPMRDAMVRVLTSTDLTVVKALYDRTKDWADIEAMLRAHDAAVDLPEVERLLVEILGAHDDRVDRLRGLDRNL